MQNKMIQWSSKMFAMYIGKFFDVGTTRWVDPSSDPFLWRCIGFFALFLKVIGLTSWLRDREDREPGKWKPLFVTISTFVSHSAVVSWISSDWMAMCKVWVTRVATWLRQFVLFHRSFTFEQKVFVDLYGIQNRVGRCKGMPHCNTHRLFVRLSVPLPLKVFRVKFSLSHRAELACPLVC